MCITVAKFALHIFVAVLKFYVYVFVCVCVNMYFSKLLKQKVNDNQHSIACGVVELRRLMAH